MLLGMLKASGDNPTLAQRTADATREFGVSRHYDTDIHAWYEANQA